MDYQSALDFLYQHTNFEAKPADVYAPERFSLDRIRKLLAALGNPHQRYPAVHIAGTKGKGSVAAMVEAILRAAGYRTGLYTSPHLSDFRERMQVGRVWISQDDFAVIMEGLRPHVEATPGITFFEIATALALEWFARREVDVAVLEVGLGGRLDATNAVTPAVCAITTISLEHTELLGDTVAAIAAEKGGIIKTSVPLVCAPQAEAARKVLERIAGEQGAPCVLVGRDWCFERRRPEPIISSQTFAVWPISQPEARAEYTLALHGAHQVENAVVAVAIVNELQQQGWRVSKEDIAEGLRTVEWSARFEVFAGDPTIVLDGAHNRESTARLVATLLELFPNQRPVLVFGTLRDKDVAGMLAELLPIACRAIMTRPDHPRAGDPYALLERAAGYDGPVSVAPTVAAAFAEAVAAAQGGGLVLVTGSVFMAGEARAISE